MADDTTNPKTRKNNPLAMPVAGRRYHRKGRLNDCGNTVYEAREPDPDVSSGIKRSKKERPRWFFNANQKKEIGPQDFVVLRRYVLRMSQEQCAAYLGVSRHAVWQWETRRNPIPFMAYELLRLLSETMDFKMAHPEWEGWGVNRNGELSNPDDTVILTPADLRGIEHLLRNELPHIRRENLFLTRELDVTRGQLLRLAGWVSELQKKVPLDYAKARIGMLLDKPRPALPASTSGPAAITHQVPDDTSGPASGTAFAQRTGPTLP